MVDCLTGLYREKLSPTHLLLDVHGVGFAIQVIPQVWGILPPAGSDTPVKIFTSLHFPEREPIQLFGFESRHTRDFFNHIKNISGFGPKTALNLLSHFPISDLQNIIRQGRTDPLMEIKGVGAKIAERFIIEMKGVLKKVTPDNSPYPPRAREVAELLKNLGYKEKEISWVLDRIADKLNKDGSSTDQLLASALDEFSRTPKGGAG